MAASKSTKAPAFQFYPKDFISSSKVQRMSLTEIGVYTLLLSHCWLDNGLPTDLSQLAAIVKMKPQQFERMWTAGALNECFHVRNGKLHNDRLDQERKKQTEFRRRQADNGAKGGRPRKTQNQPVGFEPSTQSQARVLEIADSKQQGSSSEERNDVAFAAFRDAYPPSKRKGGPLVEQNFLRCVSQAGGSAALMAALVNHIASEQWSNPKYIPGMDVWLAEERWRQRLPPAGAATASMANPKTAGNVPAFQRFIERGKTA